MALQDALRAAGIESEIFVEIEDPETADRTRLVESCTSDDGDVLVYQFATASDLAKWLVDRPGPLVVNYHNVTPPACFAPWDNELARHQVQAGYELIALAGRATLGVAVSEWNRRDLVDAGFPATAVVPPIVAVDAGESGPLDGGAGRDGGVGGDGGAGGAGRDGGRSPRTTGARWLAVGRLAPNKAVEDAVAGLLAYRMSYDPEAVLEVVGKPAVGSYARGLRAYAAELGLADAVRFEGKVDDGALADAYAHCDVLVVVSDHEGFCLPAVEAMARGLPVVAYREGALPEVLGDAGVLIETKDPATISAAVHRLQVDDGWRRRIVERGRTRVEELGLADAAARLVELLRCVSDGSPWPEAVTLAESPAEPPAG
jgi:glycosyltransferase involved in cell wall biosynthesis